MSALQLRSLSMPITERVAMPNTMRARAIDLYLHSLPAPVTSS
jgi:hypothetical protein